MIFENLCVLVDLFVGGYLCIGCGFVCSGVDCGIFFFDLVCEVILVVVELVDICYDCVVFGIDYFD